MVTSCDSWRLYTFSTIPNPKLPKLPNGPNDGASAAPLGRVVAGVIACRRGIGGADGHQPPPPPGGGRGSPPAPRYIMR